MTNLGTDRTAQSWGSLSVVLVALAPPPTFSEHKLSAVSSNFQLTCQWTSTAISKKVRRERLRNGQINIINVFSHKV